MTLALTLAFHFKVENRKTKVFPLNTFSRVTLSSVPRIGSDQKTGKGGPVTSPE